MLDGDLLSLDKFFRIHYNIVAYYEHKGMEQEMEKWKEVLIHTFKRALQV